MRLAFAITIIRATGQTFSKVGMYPPVPCLLRVQFYVIMFRVGSLDGIHMLITHPQAKRA
eukprot:356045-Chlamydomonas_euryale.AAC.2